MAEWIHCNNCYKRYLAKPMVKFVITTCGHLKCQICVAKMEAPNKCLVCKSTCNMVELSDQLTSDVMLFFKDPKEYMAKTEQVSQFQIRNATALIKYLGGKYDYAKKEVFRCHNIITTLKGELQKSKGEMQKLKGENSKLMSLSRAGYPPLVDAHGETPVRLLSSTMQPPPSQGSSAIPSMINTSARRPLPQFPRRDANFSGAEWTPRLPSHYRTSSQYSIGTNSMAPSPDVSSYAQYRPHVHLPSTSSARNHEVTLKSLGNLFRGRPEEKK